MNIQTSLNQSNIVLLNNILKHAYKTVPYYSGIKEYNSVKNIKDYENIPKLNKVTIQNHPNHFLSNSFTKENLLHKRTSGSTGLLLDVFWDNEGYMKSLIPLWKQRKKHGDILPRDKLCSFHSHVQKQSNFSFPDIIYTNNEISFNRLFFSERNMRKYHEAMMEFQPVWFDASPTSMYIFSKFIYDNNFEIPKTLKLIELSGEYLIPSYKSFVEEVFEVKVFNQYGCREANAIAYECKCGHLHCFDNTIIEILNPDQLGVGDIYITVLHNYAMPFIRYNIGDRGRLITKHQCECGDTNPILEVIISRQTDYISVDKNHKIYSSAFLEIVELINYKYNNCIRQFQVRQISNYEYKVLLSTSDVSEKIKSYLEELFVEKTIEFGLYNIKWEFNYVNTINMTQNGKFKYFVPNK